MDISQEVALVKEAQSGSEEALVALYQHYITPIYRYVYSKTGNQHETEDITSEVFFKMVRDLRRFAGKCSFKNWLYAIAKNTVADYWRRHYQKPTTSLESVREIELVEKNEPADIESELLLKEQQVKNILSNLPDNYRQVLELRFIQNYTLQETADELRITLANAKVLQYRALKKASELSKKI